MFFVDRNQKIKEIADLAAFTRAKDVEVIEKPRYSSGRLDVRVIITGLSGRRRVETREYKVNLQPLPLGGYEVYNVELLYIRGLGGGSAGKYGV